MLEGFTPPPDIPPVEVRPANFMAAGEQLAKGAQKADLPASFWRGLEEMWGDLLNLTVGWLIDKLGWIAAAVMRQVHRIKSRHVDTYNELIVSVLENMLDTTVPETEFVGASGREARRRVATVLGNAMMNAVVGELAGASTQPLQPSSDPAARYLANITRMQMAAWIEGMLVKILSLKHLDEFTEPKQIMKDILGLDNLAAIALQAPMQTVINTPFQWKLNQLYRPQLLSARQIWRQVTRGKMTWEQGMAEMALQGFSAERAEAVLSIDARFLGVGDLDYLIARGAMTHDQAINHLREQGYEEWVAENEVLIAEGRRLDSWAMRTADDAMEAYQAGLIDEGRLSDILDGLKLPRREANAIVGVAVLRRQLKPRQLTLGEVEQCVKRGILGIEDYRKRLRQAGYTPDDATTLELLLLTEVRDAESARTERDRIAKQRAADAAARAEEARRRRAEEAARLQVQGVSISKFEAMVRARLRSLEEYRAFLRAKGVTADNAQGLVDLLAGDIENDRQAQARREELLRQAAVKRVDLAQVQKAALEGVVTLDYYESWLAQAGYADPDREILVGLVRADLDRREQTAALREQARQKAEQQQLSLADAERAVRLGLRTFEWYRAQLVALGFDAEDADLLVDQLRTELAADDAARKAREAALAAAAKRKLPLADLEKAVRAGLASMSDYRGMLAQLGYDASAQTTLGALLQLAIDHDKAVAAARKAAEAAAAQRGLSLSEIERAVKLGVLTMAQYRDWLKRAGFSTEDAQVLVLSLTAEVAQAARARQAREKAAAQLAKRDLSLAQFERAVREGLRTAPEYSLWLQANGFTPAAAGTLVGLLQLQLAQDAAARAKRDETAGQLSTRGISLADYESSVKAGIHTLAEYRDWLFARGYPIEDIATLAALLEFEMQPKAKTP